MIFDAKQLQALRDCCRDEAAFARLQQILHLKKSDRQRTTEGIAACLRRRGPEPATPEGCSGLQLLEGVTAAIQELLVNRDWEQALSQALAILGQGTGVDRVELWELGHTATPVPNLSCRYQWCREGGLATATPDFPPLTCNCHPWYQRFTTGGVVHAELEASELVREWLQERQIGSLLVLPIYLQEQFWGSLGLITQGRHHPWSAAEQQVLNAAAIHFGNAMLVRQRSAALLWKTFAIARKTTETVSQRSELRLQRLADNTPGMIFQLLQGEDTAQMILYASSGAQELLGFAPEALEMNFALLLALMPPPDQAHFLETLKQSAATLAPWSWEGRICTPSGQPKWLQGKARPERQADGTTLWDGLLFDISDRKQAETALQTSENRLRRQNQVLVDLAKRKSLHAGNLQAALRDITQVAAHTLEVERVSVWLYNPDHSGLYCLDLYERSRNCHSQGMEFRAAEYPAYFQALDTERTIAAHDAESDPRTQEFFARYLQPHGINSLLDAPIWLEGGMIGVVCHEQVGPPRHWEPEEQSFAASIADMVSLAIEARDRQRAEANLRTSEERLQSFFNATFEGVLIHEQGKILDVNHAIETLFGYTVAELKQMSVYDLTPAKIHPQLTERIQTPSDEPLEAVGLKKNGTLFVAEVSGKDILFQGRPARVVGIRDATKRKRTEEALQEREQQYREIFEATRDGLIISTLTGEIVEANPAACRMYGYTHEEFIGLNSAVLNHPDSHPLLGNLIETSQKGGGFEIQGVNLRQDGKSFPVEINGTTFTYKGEPHLLGVVRDITERKRVEAQLRLAAARDRLLGEISLRIRRSLNLCEILDTTVVEVRQFLQADRVFIGFIEHRRQRDRRLQGQVVAEAVAPQWQSCLAALIQDPSYLEHLGKLMHQGEVRVVNDTTQNQPLLTHGGYLSRYCVHASLEVPIILRSNAQLDCSRTLAQSTLQLETHQRQFFGVLVAHQCSGPREWQPFEIDLLEQLATRVAIAIQQGELYQQLATLNSNLERQVEDRTALLRQKMQELQELNQLKDVFLHAVSHDLRTPVMGTLLVLNNILNAASPASPAPDSPVPSEPATTIPVPRKVLERMVQSNNRQLTLINSLLEAHASDVQGITLHQEAIALLALVESILEDLDPLLVKNQASLENLIPQDLPTVNVDANQLRRVYENLIANALKHNPPGLNLTLSAEVEALMLHCTVADNGVGIHPDQAERLFDLYFRGANARHLTGIGLGLYLCRQIINAHGGQIGVISSPGTGATFWFTLPLATA